MSARHELVRVVRGADGLPVAGAELRFYQPGTSTPVAVYASMGAGSAADQPLVSDSDGRITAYLDPGYYKIVTTFGETTDTIEHYAAADPIPAGSLVAAARNAAGELIARAFADGRAIFEADPVTDAATQFLPGGTFNVSPTNPRHRWIKVGDTSGGGALTQNCTVAVDRNAGWLPGDIVGIAKGDTSIRTVTVSGLDADGGGTATLKRHRDFILLICQSTDAEGLKFERGPLARPNPDAEDVAMAALEADTDDFGFAGGTLREWATHVHALLDVLADGISTGQSSSVTGRWDVAAEDGNLVELTAADFSYLAADGGWQHQIKDLIGTSPTGDLTVRLPSSPAAYIGTPLNVSPAPGQSGDVIVTGPEMDIVKAGVIFTGAQSSADLDTRFVRVGDPVDHPSLSGTAVILSIDVESATVGQITVDETASDSDPGTLTITTTWADFHSSGGPRSITLPGTPTGGVPVISAFIPRSTPAEGPPIWRSSERSARFDQAVSFGAGVLLPPIAASGLLTTKAHAGRTIVAGANVTMPVDSDFSAQILATASITVGAGGATFAMASGESVVVFSDGTNMRRTEIVETTIVPAS